jgi:hypothetical protein
MARRPGALRIGDRVLVWQSDYPFFAEARICSAPGIPPRPDTVTVEYLEPGTYRGRAETETVALRHCHRDGPELRTWQAARAEYARLVTAVIVYCREMGLDYFGGVETVETRELPIMRARDAARAAADAAASACERLNAYGRSWSV